MGLFDQFPYTNFHELNLDWIMQALKGIENTIDQFVAINALKYADPIQWDITNQYEKNTIVIDPLTGTAYISVQPVPSGVSLSDVDYWTAVFDLSGLIGDSVKNLTLRVEGAGVVYSTYTLNTDDWVIWNGILYKALLPIAIGTAYVVDTNIKRVTVEDYIDSIINSIGDLDSLNTTDKSNIVAAINEVLTTLSNVTGNLVDLDTTDKSNLVAAINELDLISLPFDTMADVAANSDKLHVNDVVKTCGYYSISDGGDGFYKILDATINSAYCIDIGNGLYAALIDSYSDVNARKCGLKDGGAVSTTEADKNTQILNDLIEIIYVNHPAPALTTGLHRGGGALYIPCGNYKVNGSITAVNGKINLRIHGDTEGGSRLSLYDANNNFNLFVNAGEFSKYMSMEIDHLCLTGFSTAIYLTNAVNCKIHDCMFEGCTVAVRINTFVGIYIYNNILTGCDYGFYFEMANSNSTTLYVHHNWIAHYAAAAIWIRETGANGIRSTYFNDNIFEYGPYGIYVSIAQAVYSRIYINNCHFEQCTTYAIYSVRCALRLHDNEIDTGIYINKPVERLYDLDNFNQALTVVDGLNNPSLKLIWKQIDGNMIDTINNEFIENDYQVDLTRFPHQNSGVNYYEIEFTSSAGIYKCVGTWTPGSVAFTPVSASVISSGISAPTCTTAGIVTFANSGTNQRTKVHYLGSAQS